MASCTVVGIRLNDKSGLKLSFDACLRFDTPGLQKQRIYIEVMHHCRNQNPTKKHIPQTRLSNSGTAYIQ